MKAPRGPARLPQQVCRDRFLVGVSTGRRTDYSSSERQLPAESWAVFSFPVCVPLDVDGKQKCRKSGGLQVRAVRGHGGGQ